MVVCFVNLAQLGFMSPAFRGESRPLPGGGGHNLPDLEDTGDPQTALSRPQQLCYRSPYTYCMSRRNFHGSI